MTKGFGFDFFISSLYVIKRKFKEIFLLDVPGDTEQEP